MCFSCSYLIHIRGFKNGLEDDMEILDSYSSVMADVSTPTRAGREQTNPSYVTLQLTLKTESVVLR